MVLASQIFHSKYQQQGCPSSSAQRNTHAPVCMNPAFPTPLSVQFDFNVDPQSDVIPMMDENEMTNTIAESSKNTHPPSNQFPGINVELFPSETSTQRAAIFARRFPELYLQLSLNRREGFYTRCLLPGLLTQLKRLIDEQAQCIMKNAPAYIDIAYHYTSGHNLSSICTHGLLMTRDQNDCNVKSKSYHGDYMGDGVYTANNPFAYHGKYGVLGIMVARLKGRTSEFASSSTFTDLIDSLWSGRHHAVQVSVRKSGQIVPLICFDARMLDTENDSAPGNELIYAYHYHFQKLLDRCFNGVKTTTVDFPRATVVYQERYGSLPWAKRVCSVCKQPDSTCGMPNSPQSKNGISPCLYTMGKLCTKCGAPLAPFARMLVAEVRDVCCEGYAHITSLCVKYTIAVNQKEADDHADIFAWLPNNSQGLLLLGRLQCAFLLGLTFNVAVQVKTRKCTVSWGPIPHKTRPSGGGMFGFPDENYFEHCNKVLNNHSIP